MAFVEKVCVTHLWEVIFSFQLLHLYIRKATSAELTQLSNWTLSHTAAANPKMYPNAAKLDCKYLHHILKWEQF